MALITVFTMATLANYRKKNLYYVWVINRKLIIYYGYFGWLISEKNLLCWGNKLKNIFLLWL